MFISFSIDLFKLLMLSNQPKGVLRKVSTKQHGFASILADQQPTNTSIKRLTSLLEEKKCDLKVRKL
jgi:hypothetical protein